MKIRKSISLEEDLWKKIDKKRGLISRSAYINKLLKQKLKGGKKDGKGKIFKQ